MAMTPDIPWFNLCLLLYLFRLGRNGAVIPAPSMRIAMDDNAVINAKQLVFNQSAFDAIMSSFN